MQQNSRPASNVDAVDLNALILILWHQKKIIASISIFVTLVATGYAFLSKPVYEARNFLIPPMQSDIEDYNYGRTAANNLVPFTIKDIYGVFLKNLQAESLKREFFSSVYLPALSEGKGRASQGAQYEDFSKKLAISVVGKDLTDRYSVVMQDEDPQRAAKWLDMYIDRASELARQEINKNITIEAGVQARNVNREITSLRDVGNKVREDSIIRLKEALRIAEAIGLEQPPIVSGNPAIQISGGLNGQQPYMRGAKALRAEIKNLEARTSDDPYIGKLRNLETKFNFYKELERDGVNASVFRRDGLVEVSDKPIKPRKIMVISLGLLLGLLLGAAVALLKASVETAKRKD
jgi:chain length determinant protein (polysaccharide antigen chain regulator)